MMTPQILKFIDSPKTQKSKYLKKRNIFSSNEKKSFIKGYNMPEKYFLVEVSNK